MYIHAYKYIEGILITLARIIYRTVRYVLVSDENIFVEVHGCALAKMENKTCTGQFSTVFAEVQH